MSLYANPERLYFRPLTEFADGIYLTTVEISNIVANRNRTRRQKMGKCSTKFQKGRREKNIVCSL